MKKDIVRLEDNISILQNSLNECRDKLNLAPLEKEYPNEDEEDELEEDEETDEEDFDEYEEFDEDEEDDEDERNQAQDDECPACFYHIEKHEDECPNCGYKLK
jgi:hypothetical protein